MLTHPATSSAAVTLAAQVFSPVGPLGAAIVTAAIVVLIAYGIGANERRHWGGRPPTAHEYLHGKRKMGRVQYSTAQWSQRVLLFVGVAFALGLAILLYGLST